MTYLDEWRDTVGLSALNLGVRPQRSLTQEQFDTSLAQIETAVKSGWVRQVKGNSYTEDWPAAARCWPWAGPATSP